MSRRFRVPTEGGPPTESLFGEGSSGSASSRFHPYRSRRVPPGSVRPESDGPFEEPPWPRPDPNRPQPPGPLMTVARYEELMRDIDANRKAASATLLAGHARNNAEFRQAQRAGELQLAIWQRFLLPNGERPPDQVDMDGVPMDADAAEQCRGRITQYLHRLHQETRPQEVARLQQTMQELQVTLTQWDTYNDKFKEEIHTNEMATTAWPVRDQVYYGGLSPFQMPEWKDWKGEESAYRFKYGSNPRPSNPHEAASRARDAQRRSLQPAAQPSTLPPVSNPGTGPTPFSNQWPPSAPTPGGPATPSSLLGLGRNRNPGAGRGANQG